MLYDISGKTFSSTFNFKKKKVKKMKLEIKFLTQNRPSPMFMSNGWAHVTIMEINTVFEHLLHPNSFSILSWGETCSTSSISMYLFVFHICGSVYTFILQ